MDTQERVGWLQVAGYKRSLKLSHNKLNPTSHIIRIEVYSEYLLPFKPQPFRLTEKYNPRLPPQPPLAIYWPLAGTAAAPGP